VIHTRRRDDKAACYTVCHLVLWERELFFGYVLPLFFGELCRIIDFYVGNSTSLLLHGLASID
jgi:hypothetical protein